nr:5-methyltetrahydropteroyltriglutamate--homocysteine S-methyltransferase [Thalassospira marina]
MPVSTLGTPRIGPRRELKFVLEEFWSGKLDLKGLQEKTAALRCANWARQNSLGVENIPSNDFSLYDHVLDTCAMVGAIPDIYDWQGGLIQPSTYFAMARGETQEDSCCGKSVRKGIPALEMTKWFDTNYHFMVPELSPDQHFALASTKAVDEFREAKCLGFKTRPVLLGPVSFLKLAKSKEADFNPVMLLDRLLPVYEEVLRQLRDSGAKWVQIDEPCLVLDLSETDRAAYRKAYHVLNETVSNLNLMLTTYFGKLGDNLSTALSLPVAGLHVDLVRAPEQLEDVIAGASPEQVISLGVIDGRNIWRADLQAIYDWLLPILADHQDRQFELAPSCSLLHVPIDLELEKELDPDLKSWLAFSVQKIAELKILARAFAQGVSVVAGEFLAASNAIAARRTSEKVHNRLVTGRVLGITPNMSQRRNPFPVRRDLQQKKLKLPAFPTTTIGSFPQTPEVRKSRAAFANGSLTSDAYDAFVRSETEAAIRWQEDLGIDVLVHGEFERNDMVQYFGEKLAGYAFTKYGWVQSYGSRYVRPPVIFGDVSRPEPMTVKWSRYAQSLTDLPVKGMLTGPVTMLQWSFVRDDLPRRDVCAQIAFALRDEVIDLEAASIGLIQIDEPAIREGLPLRRAEWKTYLDWAVECFRISASGVRDDTQIHTHMCYSEFNDIIEAIGAMDADVISIETSRSKMELLEAFVNYAYPNDIGPGVYDIHSPRVPAIDEMVELLVAATRQLATSQIWVNPDCGLKTRQWEEVKPALANMVEAARMLRESVNEGRK